MSKKKKQGKGAHAVESLNWDAAGTPVWSMQSEHPSHERAKEAMDKLHKERKDVSLRISHAAKTTASVTTSSDASKLRRAAPQANAATESKPAKAATKKGRAARASKADDKMSALDAAAKVLTEAKEPLNCKEMVQAMAEKGYWKSPGGLTPWATLYSAILRELNVKGKQARFKKTERGKFSSNG